MRFVTSFIIVVLALFGGLFYYGLFSPVNIAESEQGPFIFVYNKHVGSYSKIGPVIEGVEKKLQADGIEPSMGFAIYYDSPKTTPELSLKSIGGCIVENPDLACFNKLKKSYNFSEIPKFKCFKADFPYKGMPSIILGVYRVYPVIETYMKNNEIPGMPLAELYDKKHGTITYIIPKGLNPVFLSGLFEKTEKK